MPPPVFKPLPGYTVQGRNGQSCGDTELIADGITIALAIIAVSLRVFVKKSIVRQIHVEDYFVIFALLLAIARWIMYTIREYMKQYSLQHHMLSTLQLCATTNMGNISGTTNYQISTRYMWLAWLSISELWPVAEIEYSGAK